MLDLPTLCHLSACSKQALALCEGASQWDKGLTEIAKQHGHSVSNDAKKQSKTELGRDEAYPTRRSSRVKLGWAVRSARRDVVKIYKHLGIKDPRVGTMTIQDAIVMIQDNSFSPRSLGVHRDTDAEEHWENLHDLFVLYNSRWHLTTTLVGVRALQDAMEGQHRQGADPVALPVVHKIFKQPESYKIRWEARDLVLGMQDYMLADFGCGEVARKRKESNMNVVGSNEHLRQLVASKPKHLTPALWGSGGPRGRSPLIDSLDVLRLLRQSIGLLLVKFPREYGAEYSSSESDEDEDLAFGAEMAGHMLFSTLIDSMFDLSGGYGGYSSEEGHFCEECGECHF